MKISEMGYNWWVLFINNDNGIEHSIGFESLPNVASLTHCFEELKTDDSFDLSCDPDLLRVTIVRTDEYLEIMGDLDLDAIS